MSVLTVTGSVNIPDRTLGYQRAVSLSSPPPIPQISPGRLLPPTQTQPAATISQSGRAISHRHSRTISSNILPSEPFVIHRPSPSQVQNNSLPGMQQNPSHSRQSSASIPGNMQRQPTSASFATSVPRRSTSSRSTGTNAPTSYVALMRKQKATVWCDRSQNIDPRLAAAQRVARHRAALEVNGAISNSGRTSTISSGGVVGKIRHGGVPKAPGYSPANMSGAGVPMRLSANEMLGDEDDDRSFGGDNGMIHARSGSGKSSSSSRFRSGYPRPEGKYSGNNTPPGASDSVSVSKDLIPEVIETSRSRQSFPHQGSESEDSFGELKDLTGPNALQQAMDDAKKNDDLRRRGSVDERTMSMGAGVRLFVANPDLDN